jgi:hypothetical protein
MALPRSALSGLLDVMRAGGSEDVIRQALALGLRELMSSKRGPRSAPADTRGPRLA